MSWGKLLHNVRSMELRPSRLAPINDELIHLACGARNRAPPAWQCWRRHAGPRRRQAVRTRLKPLWKQAERHRAMRARIGPMPNVALNGRFSKSTTISRRLSFASLLLIARRPARPSKLRWAKRQLGTGRRSKRTTWSIVIAVALGSPAARPSPNKKPQCRVMQ